jgi:TrmH family RNA methyltransferase
MGTHFRLPLRQLDWVTPDPLLQSCTQWLAAEASGSTSYDTVDWRRSTALVLGSEATGISAWAEAHVTGRISIPMRRGVESLNAAVSGAVILFEAVRQRQTQ